MENEIFTPEELLEAWEHCMRPYGTGCGDCPNAIPGTENEDGVCECKRGLTEATMETLAAVIEAEKKRKEKE